MDNQRAPKRVLGIVVAATLSCWLGCSSGSPGSGGDASMDGARVGSDAGGPRDATTSDGGAPDAPRDGHTAREGGKHRDGSADDGGRDAADGAPEAGDAGADADADADAGPMPTEWTIVSTPFDGGVGFYGVGGDTTLDVWAVGGSATTPADIFWAGTVWTNIGEVSDAGTLLSVSSLIPDDSWTVTGATVLHWDGTGWHGLSMENNTTPLASIYAAGPGEAYAVGNAGTVLDCDEYTAICTSTTVGSSDLTAVWGVGATEAWAVGKGGSVYGYAGASWAAQTGSGTADLYAVQGSDDVDVWAVGDAIEHTDGKGTWTKDPYVPAATLRGVWAASPTEAWAVGVGGIIVAWDGAKWKSTTSPTTNDLYAIWAADVHDIWAVGANNTVLRRQK